MDAHSNETDFSGGSTVNSDEAIERLDCLMTAVSIVAIAQYAEGRGLTLHWYRCACCGEQLATALDTYAGGVDVWEFPTVCICEEPITEADVLESYTRACHAECEACFCDSDRGRR